MKRTIVVLLSSMILCFFYGCGLYQQRQTKDWVGYYLKEANREMSQNNCDSASYFIDLSIPSYNENKGRIDAFFDKPEKKNCYFEHCKKRAGGEISGIYSANAEVVFINQIKLSGIFSDSNIDMLFSILNNNLIEGNKTGKISFTLGDDFKNFPELQSTENQKYMLPRTIDTLKKKTTYREKELQALIEYISKSNMTLTEKQKIESVLPEMNLTKREVDTIKDIFPKFAEQRKSMANILVCLNLKNMNSLEQEDMKKILSQKLHGVTWTEVSTNKNNLYLAIELIRNNEITLPIQTETIIYPRSKVNFAEALLLMPNNSTYMYEFVSGGTKIEYGFAVSARKHDKEIYKNNIRGEVVNEYHKCQNQRIQNVFGGIQPANFTANNDMEDKCSPSFNLSIEELRNEVFEAVASEVLKITDIKAIYDYNQ